MNIGSFLAEAARTYPGRAALTRGTTTRTYAELHARAGAFAAALSEAGLRRGDRVVVWSHNRPEVVETYFACWHIGLVVVPVNAKVTVDEVAFHISDSRATALVYSEDFADGAASIPGVRRIGIGPEYEALLARHQDASQGGVEVVDVAPDTPAWLFYTSGTTGRPKGAILTHANLAFMVVSWCADLHQLQPEDVVLHCAPLSHGAGFHALVTVARGAHALVHDRFDPAVVLDAIAAHRVTATWLVPTQIRMLLDHPSLATADLSSLTHIVYGGAPMHAADLAEAVKRIGPVFVQLYGQGESPMTITYLRREEHRPDRPDTEVLTSTGVARTAMEVRVVDADGVAVAPREAGEIIVRGPAVMTGYWNRPDATAESLRDGWLHTGDVGMLDERGYLYVLDRMKDLIITGGSNVYAREVEEVLLRHPAVHEVAVFGVPDRTWGELVVGAVVPDTEVDPDELIVFCRERMTSFKRPRRIHVLDALPRNAYGKVLKRELRAQLGAGGTGPDHRATSTKTLLPEHP
ncbi:long-chain fatty acid--CoA ligase [Haloechinothrix salitolerans]|uniref:Long-chain fatty acid--CoA ligase n=1 Tax=Haloechinothrix salitolerans TaxID=926830 RepID=A0ABW2C2E1_9PSEU